MSTPTSPASPALDDVRVLATIGTDHHQFDRLVGWLDRWLERHPELQEHTLLQHGQSPQSRLGRNVAFLEYDDLVAGMRAASVVVVHGGPASIFEARYQGRLPVCVPRDPALDEIVDAHQQRFARKMADEGMVLLCEDEQTFADTLDRLVADPAAGRVEEDGARLGATMANLDALVRELVSGDRRRRRP